MVRKKCHACQKEHSIAEVYSFSGLPKKESYKPMRCPETSEEIKYVSTITGAWWVAKSEGAL